MLADFSVVTGGHALERAGVVVDCYDGQQRVLAIVPRDVFENVCPALIEPAHRSELVDRNLAVFARIISQKYAAGQVGSYCETEGVCPLVTVNRSDIQRTGETLSGVNPVG